MPCTSWSAGEHTIHHPYMCNTARCEVLSRYFVSISVPIIARARLGRCVAPTRRSAAERPTRRHFSGRLQGTVLGCIDMVQPGSITPWPRPGPGRRLFNVAGTNWPTNGSGSPYPAHYGLHSACTPPAAPAALALFCLAARYHYAQLLHATATLTLLPSLFCLPVPLPDLPFPTTYFTGLPCLCSAQRRPLT